MSVRIPVNLVYDPEANAAYLHLANPLPAGGPSTPVVIGNRAVLADMDNDGHLVGIEILDARALIHPDTLNQHGGDQ